MHFKNLLIAPLLFGFVTVHAQNNEQTIVIRDIIESVAENLPDDYDLSELTEVLSRLSKHPLNLNKTSPEELKVFIFLSPLQINNFFNYVKENGNLIDVLELQTIDGFDPKTVENLLPFITLNGNGEYEKLSFKNLIQLGEHDLITRFARTIEKQKGFTDLPGNQYLGSPERFQMRYRYNYGTIASAAITLEKDAGEKFIDKPVDFLSGGIALFKLGHIKKVVLGDYALQFGQGLTLWSGFSFGKVPDVTSIAKKDLGLKPYTSSNEYSFFRGVSATINVCQNIDVTPFVSFRKLDVSQDFDVNGNLVQSTINQTGLHRTPTEIANKNALNQQVYGAAIQYNKNELSIGLIAYQSKYSNNFITQNAVYDRFSFTGNTLTNIGLHYNYTYKNFYFFGEAGKSLNSGLAYINGALVSLSSIVSAAVVYRNYQKQYHNFFNQSMAESSDANNEKGFYAGLNVTPNKHWAFSVYGDYFQFPWLKYRVDAPSKGYEILGQLIYTPTKTFKVLARFKTENKQQNTDVEVPINFLDDVKRESYRLEINWKLNKKFSFQHHAEVSQYKKGDAGKEFGYLIYQDVNYVPMFSKFSGNLRIAYFNTPGYNSRIYAYEDDVLYSFAFGMYSGKGYRTYLNLKYRLAKKINIWLRYAMFIYKDAETTGTYLDEIKGNKKSEIKVQMRYQF
ncbi:helix-hairpin-helix domain-containing protein [Pedobacter punctiformis]|uniref:Helix-hairpin-helix domain-containing protein n=1 Tax=Pedobacter punctiformis TaxID=3004097 RepID=A0ABT4L707_9SPHI|nr:helix-hairpin-helix domain-containing protein [Pedobacter sp. HCMS5-2]MCZ4243695.1 helix-hairpin-helix domain-containing protein [Pedobacter sp. HCMS5-2]